MPNDREKQLEDRIGDLEREVRELRGPAPESAAEFMNKLVEADAETRAERPPDPFLVEEEQVGAAIQQTGGDPLRPTQLDLHRAWERLPGWTKPVVEARARNYALRKHEEQRRKQNG